MSVWNGRTAGLMLFGLVILAQVAVPVSMIIRREITLKNGVEYRFKTRPVDPYDAFRGRYVALAFENDRATITTGTGSQHGRRVYVRLETDENGFARLGEATATRPTEGDYLKTRVLYAEPGQGTVRIVMPFDRYYMNEQDAPEAELAYNAASRRGEQLTYAVVRVHAGMAVVENLFVDEMPVIEFLKSSAEKE